MVTYIGLKFKKKQVKHIMYNGIQLKKLFYYLTEFVPINVICYVPNYVNMIFKLFG